MKYHHRTLGLTFLLVVIGLAISPSLSRSQPGVDWFEHPERYLTIQDTLHLYLIAGNGDTLDPDWIHAGYEFDMLYDSTSKVMYTFTECRQNDKRLKLLKWRSGRAVNADAALLSFNSTTDTFRCHTGDTLSFYREIQWRDPRTGWADTDSYRALDSLDYAVELVRASDSMRVALLDSIGILPRATSGRPMVHGMYPLMAIPRFIVPVALNNLKTFIRLRVYHRGPGEYWFTRRDDVTIMLSARLADTFWFPFIGLFTPGAPKIQIENLNENDGGDRSGQIEFSFVNGSSRDVEIAFSGAPPNTAIGVYDILGNLLFLPQISTGSDGKGRAHYRFNQPGAFFIGLLNDNRIIAARKIVVN